MANVLEKETTTAASGKNSARRPRSNWFTNAAVVTLGIGFGIWWGLVRPRDVDSDSRVGAVSTRAVVPLDAFTVNLADHEEGRFLRATLALSVEGQLPTIAKGESKSVETGLRERKWRMQTEVKRLQGNEGKRQGHAGKLFAAGNWPERSRCLRL